VEALAAVFPIPNHHHYRSHQFAVLLTTQKINWWVACYLRDLADYDFKLVHKPRKLNKVDHLLRRPNYDKGKGDNKDVLVLPKKLFARALSVLDVE
jgi:hypothetical protein